MTHKYQSTCYQSQTQMDLGLTPEVKLTNTSPWIVLPHSQMLCQKSQKHQIPHQNTLTADRLEALLQMQKTDPFCKRISTHLSNGKTFQHKTDIYTHVRGLFYKHVTDSGQKFLALVIPKSWKYHFS